MDDKNVSAAGEAYTSEDYDQAALLLAGTYSAMKSERENIRRWQSGERTFTRDDALEELISVTPKSDDSLGIRVQTSGTSDPTAKIGMLLASGYVEKKQEEIMQEMFSQEMLSHIAFLDWKIGIVETAIAERMTRFQRAVFIQIFVKGRSYSEMIRSYKCGNKQKSRSLNDRKIHSEKRKVLNAVAQELGNAACCEAEKPFVDHLIAAARKDSG